MIGLLCLQLRPGESGMTQYVFRDAVVVLAKFDEQIVGGHLLVGVD